MVKEFVIEHRLKEIGYRNSILEKKGNVFNVVIDTSNDFKTFSNISDIPNYKNKELYFISAEEGDSGTHRRGGSIVIKFGKVDTSDNELSEEKTIYLSEQHVKYYNGDWNNLINKFFTLVMFNKTFRQKFKSNNWLSIKLESMKIGHMKYLDKIASTKTKFSFKHNFKPVGKLDYTPKNPLLTPQEAKKRNKELRIIKKEKNKASRQDIIDKRKAFKKAEAEKLKATRLAQMAINKAKREQINAEKKARREQIKAERAQAKAENQVTKAKKEIKVKVDKVKKESEKTVTNKLENIVKKEIKNLGLEKISKTSYKKVKKILNAYTEN